MNLNKLLLSGAAAAVAALAVATVPASAVAAPITVGTFSPGAYFFLTPPSTPFTPSITADFGATIQGPSNAFSDEFDFTIPQNGVGSGSVSVSSSSALTLITISSVSIDGTTFTAAQAAAGVSDIPIEDGVLNKIIVSGTTGPGATSGTFAGTATFSASAAPEPSVWLLMVGGVGLIGAMLRRRSTATSFA